MRTWTPSRGIKWQEDTLKPRPVTSCSGPWGRKGVLGSGVAASHSIVSPHLHGRHPRSPCTGPGSPSYLALCVLFPAKVGRLALALGNGASEEVLVTLSLLSSR